MRLLGAASPHLPNVRVHSHVALFSRKVWASKVMYRGSAVDFLVVLCTPTAAAAVGTAAGSPLLSLTSPPRPRFCAAGAPFEEDNLLHATKPKQIVWMCVVHVLWHCSVFANSVHWALRGLA